MWNFMPCKKLRKERSLPAIMVRPIMMEKRSAVAGPLLVKAIFEFCQDKIKQKQKSFSRVTKAFFIKKPGCYNPFSFTIQALYWKEGLYIWPAIMYPPSC